MVKKTVSGSLACTTVSMVVRYVVRWGGRLGGGGAENSPGSVAFQVGIFRTHLERLCRTM